MSWFSCLISTFMYRVLNSIIIIAIVRKNAIVKMTNYGHFTIFSRRTLKITVETDKIRCKTTKTDRKISFFAGKIEKNAVFSNYVILCIL